MKYKTFEIIDALSRTKKKYVLLFIDEQNRKTFEADKSNPDFLQFLFDLQITEDQVGQLEPDKWHDISDAASK